MTAAWIRAGAVCVLLAALASACRREDIRTVILTVPEMKNPACEEVVRRAVSQVAGVKSGGISIEGGSRTVTVRYDSLMASLKNIEFSVADAGFAANDVPANADAAKRLPPECR